MCNIAYSYKNESRRGPVSVTVKHTSPVGLLIYLLTNWTQIVLRHNIIAFQEMNITNVTKLKACGEGRKQD